MGCRGGLACGWVWWAWAQGAPGGEYTLLVDRCNSASGSPCDVATVDNFNKEYVFAQDAVVLSMTYTRNASLGVMYVTVYESPCLDSAPFKVTLQVVYKCVPTHPSVPVSSRLTLLGRLCGRVTMPSSTAQRLSLPPSHTHTHTLSQASVDRHTGCRQGLTPLRQMGRRRGGACERCLGDARPSSSTTVIISWLSVR
jgi:hypothetical protein